MCARGCRSRSRAITTRMMTPPAAPVVRWRGHSNLLFVNWLNYYVYQETPYDLNQLNGVQQHQDVFTR